MKRLSTILLIIVFLGSAGNAFSSVSTQITRLINKYGLKNANIGIAIQRTNSGKTFYLYNSNKYYTPASNNKLFTAVAALLSLPASFTFQTQALINPSQLRNGVLNGNLYLKFSGDPSLTSSRLNFLIEKIKSYGIKKIKGNIIVIANVFTGNYYPVGWSNTDTNYCYAAPASTLNLNKNCMVIAIDSKGGEKSSIRRLINTQNIKIINHLKLVTGKRLNSCQFDSFMTDRNVLNLSGCLPKKAEWQMSFAIKNPALKTLDTIEDMIKNNAISYSGKIKIGNLEKGVSIIASLSSGSLYYMLKHMLLHSDNLYAESFARTVGIKNLNVGTIKAGTIAIKTVISKKLGLNTNKLILEDGSGLSHTDKTTPEFMVNFLTKVYNDEAIGRRLYSALPTSGVDGTLSYRMGGPLLGKVHAKTGTLDGVVTLSGFVLTKRVHRFTFSIMINGLSEIQRKKARSFQDQVVKVLFNTI